MKKLAITALVAAGMLTAAVPAADASTPVGVCASVSELFETANVQAPPTPPAVGTVYRAVCKVTG
jgi:hypothetical protein